MRELWRGLRGVRSAEFRDAGGDTERDCQADGGGGEATYLAWLDCRALELSCPAGQFFLDKARVGLNFGETFGTEYAGFARLNFATPAAILREIVARMGEAVRRR